MKVVILQSNYLPWKGYFELIHDADVFVFYDEAKYTKNDWRNRNQIYGPNGLQWLTIPIAAEAVHQRIDEVEIQDSRWQTKHLKSIQAAYGKAKHYQQLEPLLKDLYLENAWCKLSELNQFAITSVSRLLGIETVFRSSAEFALSGDRVTRLLELLVHLKADKYITGPSARNYLAGSEKLFAEEGIELSYKDYSGYPEYLQSAEPFRNEVSIIDMLAHLPLAQIADYIWGFRLQ